MGKFLIAELLIGLGSAGFMALVQHLMSDPVSANEKYRVEKELEMQDKETAAKSQVRIEDKVEKEHKSRMMQELMTTNTRGKLAADTWGAQAAGVQNLPTAAMAGSRINSTKNNKINLGYILGTLG